MEKKETIYVIELNHRKPQNYTACIEFQLIKTKEEKKKTTEKVMTKSLKMQIKKNQTNNRKLRWKWWPGHE